MTRKTCREFRIQNSEFRVKITFSYRRRGTTSVVDEANKVCAPYIRYGTAPGFPENELAEFLGVRGQRWMRRNPASQSNG